MTWPRGCVRRREPLANHTSFRIGGPAEWFAQPADLDELIDLLRAAAPAGLPVTVIGGGTNTLAADRGLRGVVVHLARGFGTIRELSGADDPIARVCCGASLSTQRLVALAAQRGWAGVEALAGLPGQIGGAVVMNAQDIGRFVRRLRLISFDGEVHQLSREQIRFGYRHTALEPGIVVEVELAFPRVSPAQAAERIRRALLYRNSTQELRLPSAGCAFKNPPGSSAGRLIDQAGLKGARVGDAQVSFRHANFIVNLGQATCDDVLALMEHIQRRVRRDFDCRLEPEVRLIGEQWA